MRRESRGFVGAGNLSGCCEAMKGEDCRGDASGTDDVGGTGGAEGKF